MFTQEYIDHLVRLQLLDLETSGIDYTSADADHYEDFLFSFYGLKSSLVKKIEVKDEAFEALYTRIKEDDVDPDAEYCLKQQLPLMEAYARNHQGSSDPVFHALYAGYMSLKDDVDPALLNTSYAAIAANGIAQPGAKADRRFDLLIAAVLYLNDYSGFRNQLLREARRKKGLCPDCGGTYKGLFSKKCSGCGRPLK